MTELHEVACSIWASLTVWQKKDYSKHKYGDRIDYLVRLYNVEPGHAVTVDEYLLAWS